jgi:hypothetical protein
MKMRWMNFVVVGFLSVATAGLGQGSAAPATAPVAAAPTYVDENPSTPAPLKMRELAGRVHDLGGMAIQRASVSVFTEDGHTLVATMMSDKNGEFQFKNVAKGFYRVVVRVEGLCPANIPVNVESSLLAHRRLEITMQSKDIDTCSYGMGKK